MKPESVKQGAALFAVTLFLQGCLTVHSAKTRPASHIQVAEPSIAPREPPQAGPNAIASLPLTASRMVLMAFADIRPTLSSASGIVV